MLRKELTFEGGVNLDKDPHIIKSNEWQLLENLWPYKSKLLGSRPSLLHEQDILPVDAQYWNYHLWQNTLGTYPTPVPNYHQWFRHLTPLKAIFLGELSKIAMVCAVNSSSGLVLHEQFEGEAATDVTLIEGDVVLILAPNDLRSGGSMTAMPIISGVRLGKMSNLTPSMLEFNGSIIAVNRSCDYVVKVVKKSSVLTPTDTIWPNIDYRFTKLNFGDTNTDFKPDGVTVYKNRFVYFKDNKLWFSDPFQPEVIYDNAVATAYLGVFFNTELTESITAVSEIYTSTLEAAGASVLAIWTAHSMIMLQGEPATTIASTPEELFSQLNVTKMPITAGCVSQSSIVKTKHGIIWCGAQTVWFMAKGGLPVEVGQKIGPRIQDQSLDSAGRIFATYDDECYRLVLNAPGVGYNPYEAMNEMWCLSFIGDTPTKENAAWFGPQTFINKDNQVRTTLEAGGPSGLYCCAKLTNNNDDKTWYIQPYSCATSNDSEPWATRLGLASLSSYLGVDITAPFRPTMPLNDTHYYYVGDIVHLARGKLAENYPYCTEYMVINEGMFGGTLAIVPVYARLVLDLPPGPKPTYSVFPLYSKRPLMTWLEAVLPNSLMPKTHKISIQSANLTFDNPELKKLVSGYELTFKTMNPVLLSSYWWPWEFNHSTGIVLTQSPANIRNDQQNVLDDVLNEPLLTAKRIPSPNNKRFNGLTARLNITEPEYKVVHNFDAAPPNNPNWGKLRFSTDGVTYNEVQLFEFDADGISKHATLYGLLLQLINRVQTMTGVILDLNPLNVAGCGIKRSNNNMLFIDLTGQGWEWFGFIPTGLDVGYGRNIVSNAGDPKEYIYPTGPVPPCTPHSIHIAKLAIRYKILGARPR